MSFLKRTAAATGAVILAGAGMAHAALPTYTAPTDWTTDNLSTLLWGAAGGFIIFVIGTRLLVRGVKGGASAVGSAIGGRRG